MAGTPSLSNRPQERAPEAMGSADFMDEALKVWEATEEYNKYESHPDVQAQKKGTFEKILGFLGITSAITVAGNLFKGRYSWSSIVSEWNKDGLGGVRRYLVNPSGVAVASQPSADVPATAPAQTPVAPSTSPVAAPEQPVATPDVGGRVVGEGLDASRDGVEENVDGETPIKLMQDFIRGITDFDIEKSYYLAGMFIDNNIEQQGLETILLQKNEIAGEDVFDVYLNGEKVFMIKKYNVLIDYREQKIISSVDDLPDNLKNKDFYLENGRLKRRNFSGEYVLLKDDSLVYFGVAQTGNKGVQKLPPGGDLISDWERIDDGLAIPSYEFIPQSPEEQRIMEDMEQSDEEFVESFTRDVVGENPDGMPSFFQGLEMEYMDLLEKMNPETLDNMKLEDYLPFAQKIISTHNSVVFQLKHILNNRSEDFNRYVKHRNENLEKINEMRKERGLPLLQRDVIFGIGPFIEIRGNSDTNEIHLAYATSRELHDLIYESVRGLFEPPPQSIGGQVIDSASYMIPIYGSYRDTRESIEAFYAGNLREGFTRGGWAVAGWVTDGLLLIPFAGKGIKAGYSALRGAAVTARASRTARTARVAGATRVARGAGVAREAMRIRDLPRVVRDGIKASFRRVNNWRKTTKQEFLSGLREGGVAQRLFRRSGLIFTGVGAIGIGNMVRNFVYSDRFSGRYTPGEEVTYETSNMTNLPPLEYDATREIDELEYALDSEDEQRITMAYSTFIEKLKSETNMPELKYEVLDVDRIRIYRGDSSESIVLQRKADGWEIPRLAKYTTLEKAVVMANLLNSTADIIKSQDYTGSGRNPFRFARGGDIEFDVNWSWNDKKLFEANCAWLSFYHTHFGITTEEVLRLFNRWYQIDHIRT
jgi:hypothetical protein